MTSRQFFGTTTERRAVHTTRGGTVLHLVVDNGKIPSVDVSHVHTEDHGPLALDVFAITVKNSAQLAEPELLALQQRIESASGRITSIEGTCLGIKNPRNYPQATEDNRQLVRKLAGCIVRERN
jgi:hypothetical protein